MYFYISTIFVCHCVLANRLFITESNLEENAVQIAVEVANANFELRLQTVVLTKDVDSLIINKFLQQYKGSVIVQIKRNGPPPSHVVIIVKSYYSFARLSGVLKSDLKGNTLIQSNVKYLIVIMSNPYRLDRINSLLWSRYATDVIIITCNENKTIALHTYFPYKNSSNCAQVEPSLIGFWNDSINKDALYTDKVSDMKGCPMYISTNKVYHPATEEKIPLQVTRKILHRMLRDIMNFTPIFIIREYISIDSDIARNWSSSLSDVINDIANISTCSIPLGNDHVPNLHYTMPYFRIRLAWFAPPTTTGSIWWKLLTPLNGYLWLLILIVLFLVTSIPFLLKVSSVKRFCCRYLKNANKLQGVAFRIWGVLMGQTIRVKPRKIRDFYVISLWIWFTFVVRSVYQSVLIGALKTDTEVGHYEDFRDAVNDGFKFGGRSGILVYFEHDPLIKDNFQVVSDAEYETVFRNVLDGKSRFMIATSLEYSWTLCLSEEINENECGYILPDSILMVPLVIWTKKSSPFIKPLSTWLPRIIESGLLDKNAVRKPLRNLSKQSEPSAITLEQSSSCLLCLLIGYIISITVFVMEMLKERVVIIKNDKIHRKVVQHGTLKISSIDNLITMSD